MQNWRKINCQFAVLLYESGGCLITEEMNCVIFFFSSFKFRIVPSGIIFFFFPLSSSDLNDTRCWLSSNILLISQLENYLSFFAHFFQIKRFLKNQQIIVACSKPWINAYHVLHQLLKKYLLGGHSEQDTTPDSIWPQPTSMKVSRISRISNFIWTIITGASMAVQWLKLRASTVGGLSLIPGEATKIPDAVQFSQNKTNSSKQQPIIICIKLT